VAGRRHFRKPRLTSAEIGSGCWLSVTGALGTVKHWPKREPLKEKAPLETGPRSDRDRDRIARGCSGLSCRSPFNRPGPCRLPDSRHSVLLGRLRKGRPARHPAPRPHTPRRRSKGEGRQARTGRREVIDRKAIHRDSTLLPLKEKFSAPLWGSLSMTQ
jgi:hypothetical protein